MADENVKKSANMLRIRLVLHKSATRGPERRRYHSALIGLFAIILIQATTVAAQQQAKHGPLPSQGNGGKLSIEATVKYINNLLDSGLGAKEKYYSTGHIIVDRNIRMITWSRAMQVCRSDGDQCWPGREFAFFRAYARALGSVSIDKQPHSVPQYFESQTPEPAVLLNCLDEKPCFKKWTFFSLSLGFDANFEGLAKQTNLEFVDGDGKTVVICTTGDDEMTARFVKALDYLVEQVKALPSKDANDPFAQ